MPRKRDTFSWRLDVAALGVFVAGLLSAVCVVSHPVGPVVHVPGQTPEIRNLLGPAGERLAERLVAALGWAVHGIFVCWWPVVVAMLLRDRWLTWGRRAVGCAILLPCAAVALDHLGDRLGPLPHTGAGGTVGMLLTLWLRENLGPVGAAVAFGSTVAAGLALAADSAFILAYRGFRFGLRTAYRLVPSRAERASAPPEPLFVEPIRFEEPVESPSPAEVGSENGTEGDTDCQIPIHYHTGPALPPVASVPDFEDFELPPLSLLEDPEPFEAEAHDGQLRERAALLEKTYRDFGLNVKVVGIHTGPVITQYEVSLETGLRLAKVTSLADDLALNLSVPSVRIVAPLPNKNTVGIEVPNEHRAVVRLKELILNSQNKLAKSKLPLLLGKDTEGQPLVYDLAEMPHLLIAGRTGTGKSVCMNAVILSLLMTRRPDECRMVMIDPKMLELSEYGRIPHLMHPVVKDMKKAEAILSWAVDKMEERYDILSRARVRGIAGYNQLSHEEILKRVNPADEEERQRVPEKMPYIVIFVDEMGDLMMAMKKEVEGHIIRLAQKSRAAGIHLVVATQKPTVDVITGLIKSNLPARICFQVSSRSDSAVVLDEKGAEKLLGKGDMLFLQPGTGTMMRAQGAYASDEEITRVVRHVECDPKFEAELMDLRTTAGGKGGLAESLRERDELYEEAIEIILREGRGSTSLLQRALGIGYGRAARLIDFMAEDGIVGQYNGSQAREVLYTPEKWQELKEGAAVGG